MENSRLFSQIMDEYGSQESESKGPVEKEKKKERPTTPEKDSSKKEQINLMQDEERVTGAVAFSVYKGYFYFAGGWFWAPIILLLLAVSEAAHGNFILPLSLKVPKANTSVVANSLFLSFWTSESIPGFSQGQYMGTYAGIGVATAFLLFLLSFTMR